MKVILTKDVEELGNKGQVVNVADGYARNYLVPRSLAVKATDGALRQAEASNAGNACNDNTINNDMHTGNAGHTVDKNSTTARIQRKHKR